MEEAAFKLGQLLAVADIVHAGYCADVRGGAIPPALLGNQVFTLAQISPAKALTALCRRWKPYEGWVKKNSDYEIPELFKNEQGKWKNRAEIKSRMEKEEFDKAVSIFMAIYQRKKAAKIAAELSGVLPPKCDDVFRAELLLGYIAGLPKTDKVISNSQDEYLEEE